MNSTRKDVAVVAGRGKKLSEKFAEKYGVESTQLMASLKDTAFRQREGTTITDSQMVALLIVADQYGLNPFTKEIYAYPDKNAGIVPVVGVDGWSRIINENPAFDGIEFNYSDELIEIEHAKPCYDWIECIIHRKDRAKPIVVREYLDECYRKPFEKKENGVVKYTVDGPWQSHTKRMLRHKAEIQCARLAFGFSGIFDEDEADRIAEAEVVNITTSRKPAGVKMPTALEAPKPQTTDAAPAPAPEAPKVEKVMDERQFAVSLGVVMNRLKKHGTAQNDIDMALVRAGFVADPLKAEEKERSKVLEVLYGIMGEVMPNVA